MSFCDKCGCAIIPTCSCNDTAGERYLDEIERLTSDLDAARAEVNIEPGETLAEAIRRLSGEGAAWLAKLAEADANMAACREAFGDEAADAAIRQYGRRDV